MNAILALAILAHPVVVPDPPGPYSWVCGHLDAAPTLFGVMGLPAEAEERGVPVDAGAITAAVAGGCPRHTELLDSSLPLVVGP